MNDLSIFRGGKTKKVVDADVGDLVFGMVINAPNTSGNSRMNTGTFNSRRQSPLVEVRKIGSQ